MMSPSNSAERWLWRVVIAGVVCIPLLVSPAGKDSFRLPKDLFFRAESIVLICILVISIAANKIHPVVRLTDGATMIATVVIAWSFLSMLVATNRTVSLTAFAWIAGWTVIFIIAYVMARDRTVHAVDAALIPALINDAVVLMQESGLWNPFFPRDSEHALHSGLIGNSNDVGTFLVGPTIASCALAFGATRRRPLYVSAAVILLLADVANHTVTALVAIAVALILMTFIVSRKWAATGLIAMTLGIAALIRFDPPLHQRYELGRTWIATRNYDTLLSGRVLPYLAASNMFLDHPITGVGPGCFKWEYFPYKLKMNAIYKKYVVGWGINFAEVHNDHLQILAESGVPGYATLIAAMIFVGSATFRRLSADASPEERFSQLASLPLVVSFVIVALGQFPLELAASNAVNVYLFALCAAWKPNRGSDGS
jgi:O-antigen ligase